MVINILEMPVIFVNQTKTKFEPNEVPRKERKPKEVDKIRLFKGTPHEVLLLSKEKYLRISKYFRCLFFHCKSTHCARCGI